MPDQPHAGFLCRLIERKITGISALQLDLRELYSYNARLFEGLPIRPLRLEA